MLAIAYSRQGQRELSEQRANAAFKLEADDDDERSDIALYIANKRRVEWAEREWRHVIDSFSVISKESMDAREYLSLWLHDRGEFKEAGSPSSSRPTAAAAV